MPSLLYNSSPCILYKWHSLTNHGRSIQVLLVAPAFPSLRSLELGLCHLNTLEVTSQNLVGAEGEPLLPLLESLNFDTNDLSDWAGVCKGVRIFPRCVISSLSGVSPSNQTDILRLICQTVPLDPNFKCYLDNPASRLFNITLPFGLRHKSLPSVEPHLSMVGC